MIHSVHAFLRYLLQHRRIDANPLDGVRLRRRHGPRLPTILDENQVKRLLELQDATEVLGVRDRAMLELTYSSGLRRSEVVSLQLSDLVRDASAQMVRHGKGGKERTVTSTRIPPSQMGSRANISPRQVTTGPG